MTCVVGLILPASSPATANQRLPSGPAVIPYGPAKGEIETGNSLIACVDGLISPICCGPLLHSVNQRLPSGPAVIEMGRSLVLGSANSLMAWVVGLIIPILPTRELREPNVAVRARRDPVGRGSWLWEQRTS